MTLETPSRRATCATCLRPRPACFCEWIVPVAPRAQLLVLQHPLEAAHAKNSARLLHLCVAGSVLRVGESFETGELHELLHADGRAPVLLYPDTPGDHRPGAAARLPAPLSGAAQRLRLVVLDATWRKSRKMLYLNPALQSLPRLALCDVPASRYALLRKAHAPGQLSTLEAAAHALARLEGDTLAAPLLAAFDGFVAQQAAHRPS